MRLYNDVLLKQMSLRNKVPKFKKYIFPWSIFSFFNNMQHVKNQMKNKIKLINDQVLVIAKGVIPFKHNWKHINEAITKGPMIVFPLIKEVLPNIMKHTLEKFV